jgi:hypothetical protein
MARLAASVACILLLVVAQSESRGIKRAAGRDRAHFQSLDSTADAVANLDKMLDGIDNYRKTRLSPYPCSSSHQDRAVNFVSCLLARAAQYNFSC